MKKTKKIIGWTLGIVAVLGFGIYASYTIIDNVAAYEKQEKIDKARVMYESRPNDPEGEELGTAIAIEDDTVREEEITNGEEIPSEEDFQWIVHRMTHQKVEAGEKDGATEMTPERIDQLIETLGEADYEYEYVYSEILNEWKRGDFDNCVDAHNEILSLQGGTIGVATRLFTPEEERQYVEETFRK